jgi:hypothetical protein
MRITFLVLLLLAGVQGLSQSKKGEIEFVKSFWGYKFYQNGVSYSTGGIMRVMETKPEAQKLMR